jgi:histidyl-tRNA synthetase
VALGKVFEKHVLAAGQNSRGVKLRPELSILRRTQMPAVLNEGAFVDNKADIDGWNEEAELKKLGIAYAEAAAEFLKLEKLPRDEESFLVQIGTFSSREEAEALRIKYLSKKGEITALMADFRNVPADLKKEVGMRINELKNAAQEKINALKEAGFRVGIDARNEKLGYKLRESVIKKVPYMLILGQREVDEKLVSYRRAGSEETTTVSLDEFIELLNNDIKDKVRYDK